MNTNQTSSADDVREPLPVDEGPKRAMRRDHASAHPRPRTRRDPVALDSESRFAPHPAGNPSRHGNSRRARQPQRLFATTPSRASTLTGASADCCFASQPAPGRQPAASRRSRAAQRAPRRQHRGSIEIAHWASGRRRGPGRSQTRARPMATRLPTGSSSVLASSSGSRRWLQAAPGAWVRSTDSPCLPTTCSPIWCSQGGVKRARLRVACAAQLLSGSSSSRLRTIGGRCEEWCRQLQRHWAFPVGEYAQGAGDGVPVAVPRSCRVRRAAPTGGR